MVTRDLQKGEERGSPDVEDRQHSPKGYERTLLKSSLRNLKQIQSHELPQHAFLHTSETRLFHGRISFLPQDNQISPIVKNSYISSCPAQPCPSLAIPVKQAFLRYHPRSTVRSSQAPRGSGSAHDGGCNAVRKPSLAMDSSQNLVAELGEFGGLVCSHGRRASAGHAAGFPARHGLFCCLQRLRPSPSSRWL